MLHLATCRILATAQQMISCLRADDVQLDALPEKLDKLGAACICHYALHFHCNAPLRLVLIATPVQHVVCL